MTDAAPEPGDVGDDLSSRASDLPPRFKLVFGSILALTLVSLGVSVALALFADASKPPVASLIESCSTITKMGIGAIIGLSGGKVI